ncbi:phosphatidate cytidylyltransferase [Pseudarcicella hirudinis]|uniref:Phosphatidate cytidylyltransferase n=1 Tax=Pseudarcicella hirudinis TaxID=1079859 RepID=A0A1I5YXE9_9BACT|nr:phosphatidate cytidylyltransferase [Pseudarcicella hirudinis]SFQ48715.1 phosphatidate cytidylyltransferase [Pseudarcicella hirudinis]
MNEKLNNMSNLQQRVIAAIIAVPFLIFCIYYSDWTFLGLFLIIGILAQLEFYKLLGLDGNLPLTYYGTFCGVVLHSLTFLIEKGMIPYQNYYILSPLLASIFFIKLYKGKDEKPFKNIAYTFLGIIYVALPFALVTVLAFMTNYEYSWQKVLGCLFLLWASDTGAYFAGTKFGRTKLFERVSPKKSWEGSLGGFAASMIVAYILSLYFHDLKAWQWFGVGGIIVVAGTYGDLVESLFKRSIKIKDSASTIPGHGGFLDRFDGLLLSVPFIITFLKLFS